MSQTANPSRNDLTQAYDSDPYEVYSPYRPVTREARKALEPFDIVEKLDRAETIGYGGLLVREHPPKPLLEEHELEFNSEPDVLFDDGHGNQSSIYTDPNRVVSQGVETSLTPWEAVEKAQDYGWEIVGGSIDSVFQPPIPDPVFDNEELPGNFTFKGVIRNLRLEDNDDTPVQTGPAYIWERPPGDDTDYPSQIGMYPSDTYADDGYPWAVAHHIWPHEGPPKWKHNRIAETVEDCLIGLKQRADWETFLKEAEYAEVYPEWLERTGGTEYFNPVYEHIEQNGEP